MLGRGGLCLVCPLCGTALAWWPGAVRPLCGTAPAEIGGTVLLLSDLLRVAVRWLSTETLARQSTVMPQELPTEPLTVHYRALCMSPYVECMSRRADSGPSPSCVPLTVQCGAEVALMGE